MDTDGWLESPWQKSADHERSENPPYVVSHHDENSETVLPTAVHREPSFSSADGESEPKEPITKRLGLILEIFAGACRLAENRDCGQFPWTLPWTMTLVVLKMPQ